MKKNNIFIMIIDLCWLAIVMVAIIFANRHNSIREYIHIISLMTWYGIARYLTITWK